MPTGIVSGAWGYSPNSIAGMANSAEFNDTPLTYQLGLNSRPPTFENGVMVSPLTIANQSHYTAGFGKKQSEINYLKKQLK